ncbi:alpha-xylosidase [Demequina muriae]|uniref:Alpha-xylosidase n=1 Tax=Demequina muriae TaxID=3051664 RepID=A0ABT8GFY5_9MICO|nr:alpha-xylosidase [Demequina sp. EGI L300058]MDN4480347.1 alpha-xylosidase [Demequina sp. EGI L300058]
MKFTDGFWHLRPGVTANYAQEAYDIAPTTTPDGDGIVVHAPSQRIVSRGNVLNRALLTVTLSSPLEGVVRVRIEHHQGAHRSPGFALATEPGAATVMTDDAGASLVTGGLTARIGAGAPWDLSFSRDGRRLTGSGHKSVGHMALAADAPVGAEPAGISGYSETGLAPSRTYVHEQLDLGVGELIYGLGERFGAFVKNGQAIDIWNADGGTSSELSYKNVPFYLSSRGYGVLVNQPEHVSFEVGSEAVERVQFSTAGEALEYLVFDGPTPRDVIDRYTKLTGRPPVVPAWSYGLWLSTSFTTDYDEETVNSFVDGMRDRDIPLSVFHFDCFWMREFNWTDLEWDARTFPDPEGMLTRLHDDKDLRVCVWINPYIGQRGRMFAEGVENGYLVKRADGTVWQWDMWQAGMGLVDFTNPDARAWFKDRLREIIRQGVDALKTDFGERIPTDVVWHDGSSPETMHNLYTQLYNEAVWEVLLEERGEGEAVLFSRSATAGGQTMPVHWGGDNSSTYVSMAETLRGGLSLASSGFGYWSHDIGGFEGTPDPAVFKRWLAFGLLSSHSRLHGSTSYRVPWAFDDEAVQVTKAFAELKNTLMPYLYTAGADAAASGVSVARPMFFEFPDDPAVGYLDRQYMLGNDLLIAPVMSADGVVDFYLPAGTWTSLLTGERVDGGRWVRETHGFDSLPVYVRPGAVIPRGARSDRPDYDFLDGLVLDVYPEDHEIDASVDVVTAEGRRVTYRVTGSGDSATAPDAIVRVHR